MISLSKLLNKIKKDKFYKLFGEELKKNDYLSKSDKIIIAVSGGVDSIALLYLMRAINLFKISVVHINHKIRLNSDVDESFVKDLSKEMGLEFLSKALNTNSIKKNESIEEWGRKNRYRFLEETFMNTGSKSILTAHHANDQIETILMNLSRGSGILGLRGICRKNDFLSRPLLSFKKKEIIEFSQRIKFQFRLDETNKNIEIPRNFIRHQVVKPWEKRMPSLSDNFRIAVENITEWQFALDYFIKNSIITKVEKSKNSFSIEKKMIMSFPKLIKLRLIQLLTSSKKKILWSRHKIKMYENFYHKNRTGNTFFIDDEWKLLWDRMHIFGEKMTEKNIKNNMILKKGSDIIFNNKNFKLKILDNKNIKLKETFEVFDWALIKRSKLRVRSWKSGDVFQPLGMKGHQKLSDFFINNKIDQFQKERQLVVTSDDDIIWVCGLRISDKVKITDQTTEFAYMIITDK